MRLRLQDQYCCRFERSPSLRHGLCAMRSVLTWCRVVPMRRFGGGFCEFKRERKMLFQPSREGMLFSSRGAPLHRALNRYLQRVCGTEQPRLRERIGRRANADNRARYHGGQDGRRRRVAAGGALPRVVSCFTFRNRIAL